MPGSSPSSGAPVLLVDCDRDVLSDRLDALRAAGFNVAGYDQAHEALTAALTATPAIVIIDLTSCDMDGFALAFELRGDNRTRNVPIIGMISAWDPEIRTRAARAGVCVLLLEPCVNEHLVGEIRRALQPARPTVPVAARAVNR